MTRGRVAIFGLAATGFGFLLGLLVADRSPQPAPQRARDAAVVTRPGHAGARTAELPPPARARRRDPRQSGAQNAAVAAAQPPSAEVAGEAREPTGAVQLEDVVHALESDPGNASGWASELLARDPALAAEALRRWREGTDAATLEALALALAGLGTPEVEQAALEAAASEDPVRRGAALELLDRLDTPRALEAVVPLLTGGYDAETTARALFALPPAAGLSREQSAQVIAALERLARSARDPEVRRRALIALGDYGGERAEAIAVAALGAPEATVRAAAAFALERLRPRSEAALVALAARLSDPAEDPTVRDNAFRALSVAGPLPAAVWRIYHDYLLEREGG